MACSATPNFRHFETICADQNVELHDNILAAVLEGRATYSHCFTPSLLLAAVAEAGNILRRDPEAELATKPLELPSTCAHDIGFTALRDMVNASIEPQRAKDLDTYFRCEGADEVETCSHAEEYFASTFLTMSGSSGDDQYEFQIITAGDRPIFVRKNLGMPSALALVDFNVNGIPYPAGSIANVNLVSDYVLGHKGKPVRRRPLIQDGCSEILPVESVSKVAFMRLSAFALPAGQRGAFIEKLIPYSDVTSRRELIKKLTLRGARAIARRAMYNISQKQQDAPNA
ncbi:MAG: hypothetical protein JWL85_480 [Candidatus Saccharibacteria bacterium]|nr:hypothetical protein [Candidatus Saccharibacteria bacterium]